MTATTPRGTRIPATLPRTVAALLILLLTAAPVLAQQGGPGRQGGIGKAGAGVGASIAAVGEPVVVRTTAALAAPTRTVSSGVASFTDRQLRFPRVRTAWESKGKAVTSLFEAKGLTGRVEVFFRVFKREQVLEVWARERGTDKFVLLRDYPVCALSGRLGPKRREGDGQIPEGFYSIDLLNPWSDYHLSMRVDYPNAVDRFRGSRGKLGGDIYIHGGCATIGCVPVTDEWIEELYLIAVRARDDGQQRIPTHIFPTRLDQRGLRWLASTYGHDFIDYPFWKNLQQGYMAFERDHTLPMVGHERGEYMVVGTPVPEPVISVRPAPEPFGTATS